MAFFSQVFDHLFKKRDMKINKNKKIGLALGGGAVLGAAHVGVLRSLEELDIPIHAIAGTSIGAFVAALYAFGKKWRDIKEIAVDLDWLDVSKMSLSKFGLLSNEKICSRTKELLGDVRFKDAPVPLAMVSCDISRGEKVVFTEGDIATAVMASTCVPAVFVPVESDDKLLVDGGIIENVPISPLKEMNLDVIIGVDLNAQHTYKKPNNILDIVLNAIDITLLNATKLQTKEADILITPDLSEFNLIDTDQVNNLIAKGYQDSKPILSEKMDDLQIE